MGSLERLKVLVLLPSFDRGGAETYCLRLVQFSHKRSIEWHVTTGNLRNVQLLHEFTAAGAIAHRASPGRLSPIRALQFKRFLRQQEFDVLMTLTGLFGAESHRIAKSAGVSCRIAWHRRSSPAYSPTLLRRLYAHWARRQLERTSTWILSNSETALDRFHGNHWREKPKFRVISNGVDSQRFCPRPAIKLEVRAALGIPSSAIVVGHIGRFDPAKDHETLFKAVRLARDAGMDTWLLCAGTGTDSLIFRERLKAHQLTEHTRALGVRDDIERLHQAMDVFLFPSVTEGQPNALVEAMLSGVRVLASDIPPIREALPNFLYGDLFPAGEPVSPARLLSSAPDSASANVERARDWAMDRYDPKRNFEALLELIGA